MSTQIDKITEEINSQTKEEVEEINKDISEKIKQIEDATQKEVEKITSSIEESTRSSAESESKRELGKTRLNSKMEFLNSKEQGIDIVFEEGKEKLKALVSSNEYNAVLNKMIVSGAVALSGGKLTINLLKSDSSKVKLNDLSDQISKESGNKSELNLGSEEPKTKLGGAFIVKDDRWVNNTFEAVILRRHSDIRLEIAKILYE